MTVCRIYDLICAKLSRNGLSGMSDFIPDFEQQSTEVKWIKKKENETSSFSNRRAIRRQGVTRLNWIWARNWLLLDARDNFGSSANFSKIFSWFPIFLNDFWSLPFKKRRKCWKWRHLGAELGLILLCAPWRANPVRMLTFTVTKMHRMIIIPWVIVYIRSWLVL